MLSFSLLGPVSLYQGGTPLSQFRSQKEVALLIFLAHTSQNHSREFIADLLWEDRSTQQALSNLRTVLTRLRKQVEEELLVTRKTLALDAESLRQVDSVRLLMTLAETSHVNSAKQANTLLTTLDSYHGDFLANFNLSDAPRFETWMTTTREHIRQEVIAAYGKLGNYALSANDADVGIATAQRWLLVDPLDEDAHILLIQLLLGDGQTKAALEQYKTCVTLLRNELGVGPSDELTALIQRAKSSHKPSAFKPPSLPIGQTSQSSHHNLPAITDQFIGRTNAQQAILDRLALDWCRLVTIIGPGGVGKTRLATTIARTCLNQQQHSPKKETQLEYRNYADGIWLVELADVDPTDDDLTEAIAVEIATALDLRLSGADKPIDQLLGFLQHKAMLLLLDNFEHLVEDGLEIVSLILGRTEGVQLLVTSREALRIRAEWTIALQGLEYLNEAQSSQSDRENSSTDEALQSDALDLFMARYAQHQRGAIAASQRAAMVEICHMVEGLPLAIELAAALTQNAMSQAVADKLRSGFGNLNTTFRDVPQRHRSLRTVFEMSWQMLTPAVQQRLAKLSVFRGGFTQDAASSIAEADVDVLNTLTEKSLLAHDPETDRYSIHAVVRAYASEKLADGDMPSSSSPRSDSITMAEHTQFVHARYYLNLLAEHAEPLQKDAPQASMTILEPEMANVRAAWQSALAPLPVSSGASNRTDNAGVIPESSNRASNDLQAGGFPPVVGGNDNAENAAYLYNALTALSIFYQLRGLAYEGEDVMQATLRTALDWGDDGVALATRAGIERARFQNRLGRYPQAIETIEATLERARKCSDGWAEGMGHVMWGESLWRTGEYDLAQNRLAHAREIADALADETDDTTGSTLLVGWYHHHIGVINDIQGRYDAAQEHLEQACAAWRAIGNVQGECNSLNSISLVCYHQGNLSAARQAMERTLDLCSQHDNRSLQTLLLNNLSLISTEQHDYLSAHHYLQLGLELANENGDLSARGLIYTNLGKNYRLLGKTELALERLEEGMQISESIGNRALMATGMLNLAEIKGVQGNPKQAEVLYRQALNIARHDNLKLIECELLIAMAEHFGKLDESEARMFSTQAIALAETLQNTDFLQRATAIHHYLSVS